MPCGPFHHRSNVFYLTFADADGLTGTDCYMHTGFYRPVLVSHQQLAALRACPLQLAYGGQLRGTTLRSMGQALRQAHEIFS